MQRASYVAVLALMAVVTGCASQPIQEMPSVSPAPDVGTASPSTNLLTTEAILRPVSAHIRQLAEMGAGPTGLDSVAMSGESLTGPELEILQRLLPGVAIGGLLQYQTNCRPGGRCELSVRRWFGVESPVIYSDGTAGVRLTHAFRTPSMRRPSAIFVTNLHLGRSDEGWRILSIRPVMEN